MQVSIPGVMPSHTLEDLPYLRVSVQSNILRADLCLLSTLPLVEIMPSLLHKLNEYNKSQGLPAIISDIHAQNWTLTRIGSTPIKMTESLADAQIVEGDLLIIESVNSPRPSIVFDDTADAIAHFSQNHHNSQQGNLPITLKNISMIAPALAWVMGSIISHALPTYIIIALGIILGITYLLGGIIHIKISSSSNLALVLFICAYIFIFSACRLLLPEKFLVKGIAAGCFSVCLLALLIVFLFPKLTENTVDHPNVFPRYIFLSIHTAIISFSFITGLGMLFVGFFPTDLAGITAICGGWGIVSVNLAPYVAIRCAQIPLPAIPTSLDIMEFWEGSDHKKLNASPESKLSTNTTLEIKSLSAYSYLCGIIIGAHLELIGACLFICLNLHSHDIRGLLFIVIIAGITLCRNKVFADSNIAISMTITGILIIASSGCILLLKYTGVELYLIILLLILTGLIGLCGASRKMSLSSSPLIEYSCTMLEYILLALLIPLICWITNLYSLLRY